LPGEFRHEPIPPLTRLFLDRFYASDALAAETGFETNVYALLGIVITAEIMSDRWPAVLGGLRHGLTASRRPRVDMLLPDRRDFLVLTPFPIA